jgi:hypothetical protein
MGPGHASRHRPRSRSRTLISTTSREPAEEPARLLSAPLSGPPCLHDEERGRFEVFEPPASVGLMHVTVAPETEGAQVTVGLTSQSVVRGVVQVDALIGAACRAPSREAREVLTFPFQPLGRLEVPAVLGTVPGHGPRSLLSPQKVRRMLSNDAYQRAAMRVRKP